MSLQACASALCVAFILHTPSIQVHAQSSGENPPLVSQINDLVRPYVEANDFMGVIGIGRIGAQPLILPYGSASVESDVPHSVDNIFMIGSVSKQFTAVAILLLEEAGHLNTEDPISRFIPEFQNGDQITIAQLLTHTSGVEDIYSLERFGQTAGQIGTFEQVIEDLSKAELTFSPGSAYSYSNGGYAVLAAIIEEASGLAYGEFLHERIFEPLGMTSSAHDEPGRAIEGRVVGYDPWGIRDLSPAPPVSSAFMKGSGSIWSSASDLLMWSFALHGGQILSEESYQKLTSDYGHGYGFGVSVFERFGREVVGHDGRISGYASDLAYYVEDDVTIAVLSNVQSVARDEIRRLVAAALFGGNLSAPDRPPFLDQPGVSLRRLEGLYQFGPNFNVSIFEENGRLLARANNGGASELIPTVDGRWFSRMLYATVRFEEGDEGTIERLIWGEGDGAPVGIRVQQSSARQPSSDHLVGTWTLDLRPTPDAEAYFQEMFITSVDGSEIAGTYYGSQIHDGHLSVDWGAVRFAFVTEDGSGEYHTSGTLRGDRIEGLTHSIGRGFLAYWTATRADSIE